MKFEHYLSKLRESSEYKKFRNKYKDEYMCAGFFVLDFETGKHMHQIDYALPNGKIATFLLDYGIKLKISEQALKKKLPEIKGEIKTDIEALRGIVEDEMKNRTVTENIKKIIAILHIIDNKKVWNLQCILDGLGILQVHIDDSDKSVLKFEKHSLMELIKSAPMLAMPKDNNVSEKEPQPKQQEVAEAEKIMEKIKKQFKKEKAGSKTKKK